MNVWKDRFVSHPFSSSAAIPDFDKKYIYVEFLVKNTLIMGAFIQVFEIQKEKGVGYIVKRYLEYIP